MSSDFFRFFLLYSNYARIPQKKMFKKNSNGKCVQKPLIFFTLWGTTVCGDHENLWPVSRKNRWPPNFSRMWAEFVGYKADDFVDGLWWSWKPLVWINDRKGKHFRNCIILLNLCKDQLPNSFVIIPKY
jgi:hypothetical protein